MGDGFSDSGHDGHIELSRRVGDTGHPRGCKIALSRLFSILHVTRVNSLGPHINPTNICAPGKTRRDPPNANDETFGGTTVVAPHNQWFCAATRSVARTDCEPHNSL